MLYQIGNFSIEKKKKIEKILNKGKKILLKKNRYNNND